uniref:VHS domain-containing protein n=1 Tax=Oryzias latipes TaxID=8090 RepID=A0A3P9MKH0_ORYLA
MDFLIGNPFSTPVGQRIERATSGSLQAEDWGLNLEICDIINETDEGPKDAVKAIKKRIVGNKNFREIMLALTVSFDGESKPHCDVRSAERAGTRPQQARRHPASTGVCACAHVRVLLHT